MVAQHTGRQYDDDLTVGADEYSESFSTDYVDLFEPLGDDDAPIAKLKTIILSIDWEITDDILHQLNDELQDLKDVWAGNKINLIYIQALEKIGRYIFSEKANSHPNAIKLLLAFYYDLEKIVSSTAMSEVEKKQLLLQDVKKFEQFKIQIAPAKDKEKLDARPVAAKAHVVPSAVGVRTPAADGQKNVLTNLKAIVLSIDWEISDKELVRLSEEVNKLEKVFSENRAKLIFLQGLGALGNYIRTAKSSAHPDVFKLFHSFYEGLERLHSEVLSKDQAKEILLVEVKKFNAFKAEIATIASEVVVPVDEEEGDEEGGTITPAFADMPGDVHGFREETVSARSDIDKRVASFFGDKDVAAEQFVEAEGEVPGMAPGGLEVDSRLDTLFGDEGESGRPIAKASDIALLGVDVETEADDDSEEKALPLQGGRLAPALAGAGGQSLYTEEMPLPLFQSPLEDSLGDVPVIPGIDVETEADDDSEEPALPSDHKGVAPALVFSGEEFGFREAEFAGDFDEVESDLEDRLDSFFGAEIEESSLAGTDDVQKDVFSAEAASEGLVVEESPAGMETDSAEDQKVVVTESLAEIRELEPAPAGIIFEEAGVQISAAAVSESPELVFEPVGDEVEVDELPLEAGSIAMDGDLALEKKSLAELQGCVSSILSKKYEAAFPLFFVVINNLRQQGQSLHVREIFLKLLETVGQYIDTCRVEAEPESLILFQSLGDHLEQMCQRKQGFDNRREQILVEETAKVLLWQEGLISSLLTRLKRADDLIEE
jgi:pilus assembly protein FimV